MKEIWEFYSEKNYLTDNHIIKAGRLYLKGKITREEFEEVLDKRPDWDKEHILSEIDARK